MGVIIDIFNDGIVVAVDVNGLRLLHSQEV